MAQRIKIVLSNYAKFGLLPLLLMSLLIAGASGNRLLFPDEAEYHQLALSLAAGNGFSLENGQPTAYRPPGYPFFLSVLYRAGPFPLMGKLANAVLLCISAWLIGRISGSALLPPLTIPAYPVLLYTAGTLYPQTLAGCLLLLIFYLITESPPSPGPLTAAGLLLGFLILCVPSFLLTAPVLAWILFRRIPGSLRGRLAKVALLTAGSLLVVAPWTWRNWQTFHAFVPVSANSGLNLYLGNSPNAGPNTGVNVPRAALLAEVKGLNEIDTDRRYRAEALSWISRHPADAARLYLAKALNYFNFRNQLETVSQSSRAKDLLMLLTWAPLLGLFLCRLGFYIRRPLTDAEKAIYLLVITNVFLSALFFTRIRFRLPFDLLMMTANVLFLTRLPIPDCFFTHKPLTKPRISL